LCIKIPLLKYLKDVPISNKYIKEECIRRPERKRKDVPTINVIGQLTNLILGKLIVPKYLDPRSPLLDVNINRTLVYNTLIDLGVAINVMNKDIILRDTLIVMQLVDIYTFKIECLLEDILISIDSWEYPTKFIVLQSKSQSNGYHLIFGRPWLAIVDEYIDCRLDNMTIINGLSPNQIVLYPLAQPLIK
jgi:hypothetical protein